MINKKWYKSKTIIFNTVIFLLATFEQNLGLIKEIFGVNLFLILSVVVPTVNFVLRTITTKPLEK